jgi:hypothetical protein
MVDISRPSNIQVVAEFFLLWHILADVVLAPEREELVWRWTSVGGKTPDMAKDWEQLARDRLARGKGRVRSSRLEPWPAALRAC